MEVAYSIDVINTGIAVAEAAAEVINDGVELFRADVLLTENPGVVPFREKPGATGDDPDVWLKDAPGGPDGVVPFKEGDVPFAKDPEGLPVGKVVFDLNFVFGITVVETALKLVLIKLPAGQFVIEATHEVTV